MDPINNRVIEVMHHFGYDKPGFAKELEVSLPLISHISSGRNRPGLDLIQRLLICFPDLSPDWLLNGLGTMLRPQPEKVDLSGIQDKVIEVARISVRAEKMLDTVVQYHRILSDEIAHLEEMDNQLGETRKELIGLKEKVTAINDEITAKVNN